MSKKYEFNMVMTCEGCSNAAKRVLGKLGPDVTNVDVNMEEQKLIVSSTLSSDALLVQLKKTGKEVSFSKEIW